MTQKIKRRLKPTLRNLLLTHGTRSTLHALAEILHEYKQDDIDARLLRRIEAAGRDYARAMGLQWW